jgi:hypothetical protein
MSNRYSVVFHNNGPENGSACIFQRQPDLDVSSVMSLAWFSKHVNQGSGVIFDWTLDYSFVWSQTGTLVPGATFIASQVVDADLTNANEITLDYNGGYRFTNPQVGPIPGTLEILQDGTLPANDASVGIGMSGSGTFAVQAEPRITTKFTPRPQYWIGFGNYSQGQVLDVESMTDVAQIKFPAGVYSMSATLNDDNTWSIEPLHSANKRLTVSRQKQLVR